MSNHSAGIRKKKFLKYFPTKSPNDWFYSLPLIRNIYHTDKHLLEKNYYDNGIVQTDYYISQLFKQLESKGYLKNSIIWIIADHGEGLGEHGHYGHIGNLYNEETHIPMIIIDSQSKLYKERNFATQLDVAPTILDRIGIPSPKSWRGISLLKKKQGVNITYHDVPNRKGDKSIVVRMADNQIFKMLYNEKPFHISGIYNLSKDMKEKNNLNSPKNKKLIDKHNFLCKAK